MRTSLDYARAPLSGTTARKTATTPHSISALLTIPTAGREVWETYFGQPKVEVVKTSPLNIAYSPANKLIVFSCGLVFNNNGYTAERVGYQGFFLGCQMMRTDTCVWRRMKQFAKKEATNSQNLFGLAKTSRSL